MNTINKDDTFKSGAAKSRVADSKGAPFVILKENEKAFSKHLKYRTPFTKVLENNNTYAICHECNSGKSQKKILSSNWARHNKMKHPENINRFYEQKTHFQYCDICQKNIQRKYFKKHITTQIHQRNTNLEKYFNYIDQDIIITKSKNKIRIKPKLLMKEFDECKKHITKDCKCKRIKNYKCRHESYELNNDEGVKDLKIFMTTVKHAVIGIFKKWTKKEEIKVNISVFCSYKRGTEGTGNVEYEEKHLQTTNYIITKGSDFNEKYNEMTNNVLIEHDRLKISKSGWVLDEIMNMRVNVNKYDPLRASLYIQLPRRLANKNAIINIKNEKDNKCFLWSLLAGLYPVSKDPQRISKYKEHEFKFNNALKGIEFPVKIHDIEKIEKRENGLSINVYCHDERYNIHPLKVAKDEKKNHIDLLYLTKNNNSHYCLIKDLWKLVGSQISKNEHKKYICKMCLQSFSCTENLEDHKNYCGMNKPVKTILPRKGDNILEFDKFNQSVKVPFVIYADFESVLKELENEKQTDNPDCGKKSIKFQEHIPSNFVYYIKYANGEIKQNIIEYNGLDAATVIYNKLRGEAMDIAQKYLDKIIPIKDLIETQK